MSKSRHCAPDGVLVRFWALDHYQGEQADFPPSDWPVLIYAGIGTLGAESVDQYWLLPAHRALWIPANHAYRIRTLAPASVRSLFFAPGLPVRADAGPIDVGPLLREAILAACARGPLQHSRPDHAALAALLRCEVATAPRLPTALAWPRSDWLREFATRALEGRGSPESLIAATGYSRRTLERAMRQETALSLGRWLRQARMLRSLTRLGDGSSVAEAALAAGYSEPSAYIQAFRRAFSTTPGRALVGADRLRSS